MCYNLSTLMSSVFFISFFLEWNFENSQSHHTLNMSSHLSFQAHLLHLIDFFFYIFNSYMCQPAAGPNPHTWKTYLLLFGCFAEFLWPCGDSGEHPHASDWRSIGPHRAGPGEGPYPRGSPTETPHNISVPGNTPPEPNAS